MHHTRPCPHTAFYDTRDEANDNKYTYTQYSYIQKSSINRQQCSYSTDLYHHRRHHAIKGPANKNRPIQRRDPALYPLPTQRQALWHCLSPRTLWVSVSNIQMSKLERGQDVQPATPGNENPSLLLPSSLHSFRGPAY